MSFFHAQGRSAKLPLLIGFHTQWIQRQLVICGNCGKTRMKLFFGALESHHLRFCRPSSEYHMLNGMDAMQSGIRRRAETWMARHGWRIG